MTYIPQPKNLSFDFINTETIKGACKAKGLVFNDDTTRFPTNLYFGATAPVVGTWANVAGEGWLPTIAGVNLNTGAFIIPIKSPDYILTLEFKYDVTHINNRGGVIIGELTESNHIPIMANIYDASTTLTQLQSYMYSNNGNDAFSLQYTGTALAGTGVRTYKLKKQNGCVSLYDAQDSAWHNYEGHQGLKSYMSKYHIVFMRIYDANIASFYFRSLTIEYI